jgi:hypothetical protein
VHGYTGWWHKVELFRLGRFTGRVLFLDLDVVITGDLAPLVDQPGIVNLRDWGWETDQYCSSTMVWDSGEHCRIFDLWTPDTERWYVGDQDWIYDVSVWQSLPALLLRSFKYHCAKGIPEGCSVIAFHGNPKPHEAKPAWVRKEWDGGARLLAQQQQSRTHHPEKATLP